MPERLLVCYVAMLPRLTAEEQLRTFEAASVAWMERSDRSETFRKWQRLAKGGAGEPEQMTEQQFRDRMAGMGFALEG